MSVHDVNGNENALHVLHMAAEADGGDRYAAQPAFDSGLMLCSAAPCKGKRTPRASFPGWLAHDMLG